MWQRIKDITDDFIDYEDIIAKVQYLEYIVDKSPYVRWQGKKIFSSLITDSIDSLPQEHRRAALVLYANIIYIPEEILNRIWIEIGSALRAYLGNKSTLKFSDSCYFALDNTGLIEEFTSLIKLTGRMDYDQNPRILTISGLLSNLNQIIINHNGCRDDPAYKDILKIMQKKNWVLLTDNVISGGSLASELHKFRRIKNILFPKGIELSISEQSIIESPPQLIVAAQIITEQAISLIRKDISQDRLFFGLKFDDSYRITSENCRLFNRIESLHDVRLFCEWFGDKCFLFQPNPEFRIRLLEQITQGGQENYAFGWKNSGYTLVTKKHAVSNSVPPIYYTPPEEICCFNGSKDNVFKPPFPRDESRLRHVTSNDGVLLSKLEEWENMNKLFNVFYS